jgi:hypothetical protein
MDGWSGGEKKQANRKRTCKIIYDRRIVQFDSLTYLITIQKDLNLCFPAEQLAMVVG